MRGGAYLSGLDEAMVIDVGGTTTDVGQLKNGFPREANSVVKIGGVRTLFRMPDLISIGLGGGSHRVPRAAEDRTCICRLSAAKRRHRLWRTQLTTSDVAVAAGLIRIGEPTRVTHLEEATWARVLNEAKHMIEESVDRMKTEAGDVPLIAVGGGAFLVPDRLKASRASSACRHGDCANAVGAAIAQVSGEVDQVFRDLPRSEAIAKAAALAADRAVAAGADRATLKTIETEDIPIAYLPGNSIRVRVRLVGDVAERFS